MYDNHNQLTGLTVNLPTLILKKMFNIIELSLLIPMQIDIIAISECVYELYLFIFLRRFRALLANAWFVCFMCYLRNEEDVGRAIKMSGVPREDIFVVTKLWSENHGYKNTIEAFHQSLLR